MQQDMCKLVQLVLLFCVVKLGTVATQNLSEVAVAPLSQLLPATHQYTSHLQSTYSRLPLSWDFSAPAGSRISLMLSDWKPPNMLETAVHCKPQRSRPMHILFLGDSLDYRKLIDFCLLTNPRATPSDLLQMVQFREPLTGQVLNRSDPQYAFHEKISVITSNCSELLQLGQRYMFGVSPQGPYHVFGNNPDPSFGCIQRTKDAITTYQNAFGLAPDAVVLASNFWDLARVYEHRPELKAYVTKELPNEFLEEYRANLTSWIQSARAILPADTLLVYRTHPSPQVYANSTTMAPFLGCLTWVLQLNAVARLVARNEGLFLVDEAHMTSLLFPTQYQGDNVHPNTAVNNEALNAVLNLVVSHKVELLSGLECR